MSKESICSNCGATNIPKDLRIENMSLKATIKEIFTCDIQKDKWGHTYYKVNTEWLENITSNIRSLIK